MRVRFGSALLFFATTTGNAVATAQANGDRRITATLVADSLGTPSKYDLSIKQGKAPVLDIKASAAPSRLSIQSTDQQKNESMKEYVLAPGVSVILDEDVFDQYFLVALHRRSGPLRVIVPQSGREFADVLTVGGMESIEIGGRPVTATRYLLGAGRQFWVDAVGRLLRVLLPGNIVATREELPR